MKIIKLCAFLLASISLSVAAQDRQPGGPTAADFFVKAPIEVVSQLPEISRLDMIDYFANGSSVKNENRLGRKVGVKSLSNRQIVWQDEDSITCSVTVLPIEKSSAADTLLLVIRTFNGSLPDSDIRYYDKSWTQLSGKRLPQPVLSDWLAVNDRKTVAQIQSELPFVLTTAVFDEPNQTLVITNRTADYFVAEDYPQALGLLKPELRYVWNGKEFKSAVK